MPFSPTRMVSPGSITLAMAASIAMWPEPEIAQEGACDRAWARSWRPTRGDASWRGRDPSECAEAHPTGQPAWARPPWRRMHEARCFAASTAARPD
eukprot:1194454-Prorocentrum_minimum.AAC.2